MTPPFIGEYSWKRFQRGHGHDNGEYHHASPRQPTCAIWQQMVSSSGGQRQPKGPHEMPPGGVIVARSRVSVTVSPAMTVALEILAERSNLPLATQAMVVLRAALDRTITSAEGQDRLRKRMAHRTVSEWREDAWADRVVEGTLERVTEQAAWRGEAGQ